MKRQFVMLAHTLDELDLSKANLHGWFLSEKLDGLRMYWDGGISRGLPAYDVPFANVQRDNRFVDKGYLATGLWSRNAKVIRAPEWFLDALPNIPLDGEVWAGRKNWEITSSIVKQNEPNENDWRRITYQVFDCPSFDIIFGDGDIKTDIYTKSFNKTLRDWVFARADKLGVIKEPGWREFEFMLGWLKRMNFENDYVKILEQNKLPIGNQKLIEKIINQLMEEVVVNGGEGVMLRKAESYWAPERSHNLLKLKKWYDAEGIVVGYSWGRKTNKGSKHLGKMGALVIQWHDKTFEISGFTDSEREILTLNANIGNPSEVGRVFAGERIREGFHNPTFPIGSNVTFRYRDLTAAGIPKNGNFHRIAEEQ